MAQGQKKNYKTDQAFSAIEKILRQTAGSVNPFFRNIAKSTVNKDQYISGKKAKVISKGTTNVGVLVDNEPVFVDLVDSDLLSNVRAGDDVLLIKIGHRWMLLSRLEAMR